MIENEISTSIIDCAMRVYTELGPGLLENAYEACLYYELLQASFVSKQAPYARCLSRR